MVLPREVLLGAGEVQVSDAVSRGGRRNVRAPANGVGVSLAPSHPGGGARKGGDPGGKIVGFRRQGEVSEKRNFITNIEDDV